MEAPPPPPPALLASSLPAGGLAVLGDWYEEQGSAFWSAWFRDEVTADERREHLLEHIPTLLRRAGFQEIPQRLHSETGPLGEAFWRELSWTVHDPDRLDDLFAWPPLLRGPRSLHLQAGATHYGDTPAALVIEALLARLLARWPEVDFLDLITPVSLETLEKARFLRRFAGTLRPTQALQHGGSLPLRTLCTPAARADHFTVWARCATPELERLELLAAPDEPGHVWQRELSRFLMHRPVRVVRTRNAPFIRRMLDQRGWRDIAVEDAWGTPEQLHWSLAL
ncbi:MAG: hypothetical protein R3F61_20795 [Myxococcota bacterium]